MATEETEIEFDGALFDSMADGSFEPEEAADAVEDDEDDESEAVDTAEDSEDDEYQEDTDQEDESTDDEELDDADDGQDDEDSDEDDEDEEEDSLVEDYSSDDESSDDEEVADETTDEEATEESEEEADTEDTSDGEDQDTDGIDYKAFYDAVVNTEFVVNGKKVKGFSDPQKIIQSQQMAGGFSEKMAGFKQYRPFMAPLKERGMLEDPAKFDLAMNLVDGDKEAIKQHLQTLGIDPLDLDMEQIEYTPKKATASNEELIIEDTMERARAAGVEDRVRTVIGNEWDAVSFQEFLGNEAVRNDLLNHIETGVYDKVQDKILELSRLDYNGAFGAMTSINKYRTAVMELQKEQAAAPQVAEKKPARKAKAKSSVKDEKAKILQARKEEEYKEKAAKREAKIAEQKKKAASVSRKKAKAKPKPAFDPMQVEGKELDDLMDLLIMEGRRR